MSLAGSSAKLHWNSVQFTVRPLAMKTLETVTKLQGIFHKCVFRIFKRSSLMIPNKHKKYIVIVSCSVLENSHWVYPTTVLKWWVPPKSKQGLGLHSVWHARDLVWHRVAWWNDGKNWYLQGSRMTTVD